MGSLIKNQVLTEFKSVDNEVVRSFQKVGGKLKDLERRTLTTQTGFFKLNETTAEQVRLFGRWETVSKKVTSGFQRFRGELLSVLFFGAAISAMFLGWLQPALAAFGVFDLWNAMLTVVFIPIISLLAPIIFGIIEAFINLPEPVQLIIGAFVLIIGILGLALSAFGALGLGILGLALINIPALIASIAPLLITFGVVIAALAILFFAWETNFLGFRDIAKTSINAIVSVLGFLLKAFQFVFNGIMWVVNLAWSIISVPFNFIKGFLGALIDKYLPGVGSVWERGWKIISGAVETAWGILKPIFGWISDFMDGIGGFFSGLGSAASSLGRAFGGSFAQGGVVPGRLGQPVPVIAHGGERFLGTSGGSSSGGTVINFNPNYTINVSDKSQMEAMIKKSNESLVSQLKSMTAVK